LLRWGLANFFLIYFFGPSWPSISIVLISASQVAGITGVFTWVPGS
jgi:hypothetical protein